MLTALLILCATVFIGWRLQTVGQIVQNGFPRLPTMMASLATIDLTKALPEGQDVTFDEFRKNAGDEIADLLSPVNPTVLRRDGTKVTITTPGSTVTKSGVTIYVAKKVSADIAISATNVVTLTKVQGIDVKPSAITGRCPLREAVITPLTKDTARIDGKLEISIFLPWVSFSVTVDTTPPAPPTPPATP